MPNGDDVRRPAGAANAAMARPEAADPGGEGRVAVRWLSRRAVGLHVALAVVSPLCLFAGWWQADRAMSGNTLSYFYAVEWPIFSVLAVWGWWQLVHCESESRRLPRAVRRPAAGGPVRPLRWSPEQESPSLRAYNRYLGELEATGRFVRPPRRVRPGG